MIIKIIIVAAEFFSLITVTGLLTILAVLSRLLEFAIVLGQPACLFLLRQSRRLITCSIVWCGQMTCRVLSTMSSMCPSESRLEIARSCTIEFPSYTSSYNPEIRIGIVPAAVPYTRTIIEGEHLVDFIDDRQEQGQPIPLES